VSGQDSARDDLDEHAVANKRIRVVNEGRCMFVDESCPILAQDRTIGRSKVRSLVGYDRWPGRWLPPSGQCRRQ
jgi:hypothetical protein